jgi:anthraniloyl-CoA monooxygenase
VRIVTVGGGPAGLYASLLLKKVDPRNEVTVVERNPADATYGWGVVFSDQTLTEFREADYSTYRQITDRFVQWDAIDILFGGELVRSGGHVFAGIARKELLGILQRRCDELGVDVRFQQRIDDFDSLPGHDVLIGADGVASVVRRFHEKAFRPAFEEGGARYIWYGTNRPLDSFTFIFRESEHGLFQVHAYPFDGTTSTWIVECSEDTWRRSGLDEADEEESIAFCERLFADDLRENALMSNNSRWLTFATLRCKSWRHGTVVLLGDAAHTAHFSIGSGTKLAMEDAISLARAFEHSGELLREHRSLPAPLAPTIRLPPADPEWTYRLRRAQDPRPRVRRPGGPMVRRGGGRSSDRGGPAPGVHPHLAPAASPPEPDRRLAGPAVRRRGGAARSRAPERPPALRGDRRHPRSHGGPGRFA